MNDIELTTYVFDELIAQGGCSTNSEGSCAYRGSHGRRCAAGVLIKHEDYKPSFEGQCCSNGICGDTELALLFKSYSLDPEKIHTLQSFHDTIALCYTVSEELAMLNKAKKNILSRLNNGGSLLDITYVELERMLND